MQSQKSAVIIRGNPKYLNRNKDVANKFYNKIQDILERRGFEVSFDPGHPFTQPKDADLWVGHSRGIDRLQFAPSKTTTIALSTRADGGDDPLHYELSKQDLSRLKNT